MTTTLDRSRPAGRPGLPALFAPDAPVRPEDVRALVDFGIPGETRYASMARLQEEGVAAIYNVLCRERFAYLADEVGMGKTYQTLGLAALIWNLKPDARVVVVAPRQAVQEKWYSDYDRFFQKNYRPDLGMGDDRVTSVLLRTPVHERRLYHRLSEWAVALSHPAPTIAFLRHTSFTRPIFVTGKDTHDVRALWERTGARLRGWGLHQLDDGPADASPGAASLALNLAFGRAFNRRLAALNGCGPVFDLVVVDEAQCLRHNGNQTNQVLFAMLQGQVRRWLFLSATPVHGGPQDLANILNHYPEAGDVVPTSILGDAEALQRRMETWLVRRPRRYVNDAGRAFEKPQYRVHDEDSWAEPTVKPLATLAMGVVQKGLVPLLEGRNNRYRIGFLSCFESLQASVAHLERPAPTVESDDGPEDDAPGDFYTAANERHRDEPDAPDSGFISRLARDFEARFDLPLPHPKLDRVVDAIAPRAFGTNASPGGEKFLVFTRRRSTVGQLRDRLDRRFHQAVQDRVRRCWGVQLDWEQRGEPTAAADVVGVDEDPESSERIEGDRPFRRAMAEGGWLFRYRQTFRSTGRNALFFEENWLARLCAAGGRGLDAAIAALPPALWSESVEHATHKAGRRPALYRAERLRYLAVQGALRCPDTFGLGADEAAIWSEALGNLYPKARDACGPAEAPREDPGLFSLRSLWTAWDERFAETDLDIGGRGRIRDAEELYRRQVLKTLIGQTFRLTDTLIDLYHADGAGRDEPAFLERFMDFLTGGDPAAARLRRVCADWIRGLDVVLPSCFDVTDSGYARLASQGYFPQMNDLAPVLGVVGGSGGNREAVRQFRMPTYPQVLVCTDTLKEGVDLHLFCDQVAHYGVAWTGGDLEQRVGRVDRFFSQIERRLCECAAEDAPPKLTIYYPHVRNSLERGQVARVCRRQREAERLLDSPLRGSTEDERELTVDDLGEPLRGRGDGRTAPFAAPRFPATGTAVVAVSRAAAAATRKHYDEWSLTAHATLRAAGLDVAGLRRAAPRDSQPPADARRCYAAAWGFESALGRYVLTIDPSPWDDAPDFTGERRRRVVSGNVEVRSVLRVAVPRPNEHAPEQFLERVAGWLDGQVPEPDDAACRLGPWPEALRLLDLDTAPRWTKRHRCELSVRLGRRHNAVTLYAYRGVTRLVAPIAPLAELIASDRWLPTREPLPGAVRRWAADETAAFALGYLDVHPRDGLCFGVRLGHGAWGAPDLAALVTLVAERADAYEAALVGEDRR